MHIYNCERFEPRSHFKRLSLKIRENVVLNRTVVVDSDGVVCTALVTVGYDSVAFVLSSKVRH